jgi:hypothetical protein
METLHELKARLEKIERDIAEAERRLPAHSVKPATMAMLLELEDERDAILAAIRSSQTP